MAGAAASRWWGQATTLACTATPRPSSSSSTACTGTSCLLSQRLDSRLPYAAFSTSSERMQIDIEFETFAPMAEGGGDAHLEVGGRLIASPLPPFRSRRRETLKKGAGSHGSTATGVCGGDPSL